MVFPETIVESVWPRVQRRLETVGTRFDPWQQGFSTVALGLDSRGKYASTIGGVVATIPRQVGKTFTVGSLLIGLALEFPGHRIIWTSHHLATTKNTLQSMQGMVMRKRMRPHIRNVYTNNNDMRIAFNNGSVIMFGAREHGFGRGMDAIDILVFDEAQKLGLGALEDMVPATNQARGPFGGLLFFIGTPPRPQDNGEAFAAKRRQAIGGASKQMVYVEFSADRDADPMDRKQWRKANPSYPHRTNTDSMLRMRENIPDDAAWLREAMGIWDEEDVKRVVSSERWAELEVPAAPEGVRSYGVAFSFDDTRVSVAGAIRTEGPTHAELIDAISGHRDTGVSELVHWFCDDPKRPGRWRQAAQIALCGRAGATVLYQALRDRGVPAKALHLVTTTEYTTACAMTLDAVRDGSMTHLKGQDPLDTSVTTAEKKPRGQDGAWGWKAPEGGDETPTEAMTVALWAAKTSKRKPGRTSKVVVM